MSRYVQSSGDGYISTRMRIPAELPTENPPPPPSIPPEIESKFQYWQEIAVTQMTIDHNLGIRPAAITLVSEDGRTRYLSFGTTYVDNNRVLIATDIPFRGWVLVS